MQQVLNFLNGRKTLLGLFAFVAYQFLVLTGLWAGNQDTYNAIIALIGIGVAHKVVKGSVS